MGAVYDFLFKRLNRLPLQSLVSSCMSEYNIYDIPQLSAPKMIKACILGPQKHCKNTQKPSIPQRHFNLEFGVRFVFHCSPTEQRKMSFSETFRHQINIYVQ